MNPNLASWGYHLVLTPQNRTTSPGTTWTAVPWASSVAVPAAPLAWSATRAPVMCLGSWVKPGTANPKIAGKWMFMPLKLVCIFYIGIDPIAISWRISPLSNCLATGAIKMFDWWFGTCFIFHFIYGMSSFPLTNSIIFQDGSNHQPVIRLPFFLLVKSPSFGYAHFTVLVISVISHYIYIRIH